MRIKMPEPNMVQPGIRRPRFAVEPEHTTDMGMPERFRENISRRRFGPHDNGTPSSWRGVEETPEHRRSMDDYIKSYKERNTYGDENTEAIANGTMTERQYRPDGKKIPISQYARDRAQRQLEARKRDNYTRFNTPAVSTPAPTPAPPPPQESTNAFPNDPKEQLGNNAISYSTTPSTGGMKAMSVPYAAQPGSYTRENFVNTMARLRPAVQNTMPLMRPLQQQQMSQQSQANQLPAPNMSSLPAQQQLQGGSGLVGALANRIGMQSHIGAMRPMSTGMAPQSTQPFGSRPLNTVRPAVMPRTSNPALRRPI